MRHSSSELQSVAHAVALKRLQARRGDDAAAGAAGAAGAAEDDAACSTGFADTVPLWFRSEAFAEDVADVACRSPADPRGALAGLRGAQGLRRIDAHVIAAGAAVLRLTLQALRLRHRS